MVDRRTIHTFLGFTAVPSGEAQPSKGDHMPVVFMIAALCAGLTCGAVWLALGGSGLMAFVVYVLSGQLVIAALLGRAAIRELR